MITLEGLVTSGKSSRSYHVQVKTLLVTASELQAATRVDSILGSNFVSDGSLLSDTTTDDQSESAYFESDSITEATASDITVLPTSHYPKRVKKPPDCYM